MNEIWSSDLARVVAATLAQLAPRLNGETIAILALECHPWHGTLALCALTESECDDHPELRDPAEMAAWKHFDASADLAAWRAAKSLGDAMRSYYDSADDHATVAGDYLQSCANALLLSNVADALSEISQSPEFRFSVTHPDDGTEYCGP